MPRAKVRRNRKGHVVPLAFDFEHRKKEGWLQLEDLVGVVEAVTELPREVATQVVKAIFKAMKRAMLRRERIMIRGLGRFVYVWYAPTTKPKFGRRGEWFEIPGKWVAKFEPVEAIASALAAQECA